MAMQTVNPATGEVMRSFEEIDDNELERRVALAAEAFHSYRTVPFAQRAAWMTHAAEILEAECDGFARIMTLEMGKPLGAARDEAVKCAAACRFYAERAEALLEDEPVELNGARAFVLYQPLGPVLAVMPWNFPFWQVFRFVAPGLMAGNVGLLKHASNVPQCALVIEEIVRRAGFPDGVFQTLLIGSRRVEALLADDRIAAATLTGSEPAGSKVAAAAGSHIKKTVLELGGSDPFIVLPSADLERTAATAVKARTINNGQSCIAAKRFIVHEAVADEFERRFVDGMRALRVGDPMDAATDIGPLATEDIRDGLAEQVERAVAAGARLLCGGHRLERPGWFYEPTALADLPAGAPVYREEFFGPVAQLFRVRDVEEAIRLANDTPFGLGSSVWSENPEEQARCIEGIEAGMVFVNGMVASAPQLPFGGVKHSGYGRELSHHGIREFVNTKTVWISTTPPTDGPATE